MKATLLYISLIITSLALVTQIGAKIDLETAMGIWLFDGNRETVATDISGNNNHGEIQGAEWVKGKFGTALKFNGTSARVVIADSDSLYAKKAWTITSWVFVGREATDILLPREVQLEPITPCGRIMMLVRGPLTLWKAVHGKRKGQKRKMGIHDGHLRWGK